MTKSVLIVDDNADNRRIVTIMLEDSGYVAIEASSGEDGLQKVSQKLPDLILLDINMPGLDGFEVCQKLKENSRSRNVPVIFLTAQADYDNKVKGLKLGGADYIIKPFDRAEVLARIGNQIQIQSLMEEIRKTNEELEIKQAKLDSDLRAAAEIQKSLLPKNQLNWPQMRMAWKFLPCDFVAGDLFNVLTVGPNKVAFYMLDVSGHGVASALVTSSVSQSLQPDPGEILRYSKLHGNIFEVSSPATVLTRLNKQYPIERFDKFLTIIYMVLDIETGDISYSNAGHPPGILLRTTGKHESLTTGGGILGVIGEPNFDEATRKLELGDKVILYTDGVTECQNKVGKRFGEERFLEIVKKGRLKSIDEILNSVIQCLEDFSSSTKLQDDVSILGFEWLGGAKAN